MNRTKKADAENTFPSESPILNRRTKRSRGPGQERNVPMPATEGRRKGRIDFEILRSLDDPWLVTEERFAQHFQVSLAQVKEWIGLGLPAFFYSNGSVRISTDVFDQWSPPITEPQPFDLDFFRYPGGKAKLQSEITKRLPRLLGREFREPFVGSGRIGLKLLADKLISSIWINDADVGVASFWTAVMRYPEDLVKLVREFTPTVKSFDAIKEELRGINEMPKQRAEIVDIGFKKLVIQQSSYSGLGTMSGPLGGSGQTSEYKVDSRWSSPKFCEKIQRLHHEFKAITVHKKSCSNIDFSALITDTSRECVLYLDPPYFNQGPKLYQRSFNANDHERLASLLRKTKHPWVLSYDDCSEIRRMYEWAKIDTIEVTYSIRHLTNSKTGRKTAAKKTELLICP